MMKRITTKKLAAVREIVRKNVGAYTEKFGVGPCAPIAKILADAGWGELAICEAAPTPDADRFTWYPHYVVVRNGKILDASGEYLMNSNATPAYRDLELTPEMDSNVYGADDVAFWQPILETVLS